jgi:hypothetical protein
MPFNVFAGTRGSAAGTGVARGRTMSVPHAAARVCGQGRDASADPVKSRDFSLRRGAARFTTRQRGRGNRMIELGVNIDHVAIVPEGKG